MVSKKQFVCGRSHAILSILLLISSTYSFSMEVSLDKKLRKKNSYRFPVEKLKKTGKNAMQMVASVKDASKKNSEKNAKPELFADEEIWRLKDSYENAPDEVKWTVECIKNPLKSPTPVPHFLIFDGPQGGGKTLLAKAIAYHLDWKLRFKGPEDFNSEWRSKGSKKLKKQLVAASKSLTANVFIIDELNDLLEHFESESHDTGSTSKAFWRFLDTLKSVENFLFIGTMNRTTKLAPPLKQRLTLQRIKIADIIDPVKKREAFLRNLLNYDRVVLDPACDEEVLDKALARLTNVMRRDFEILANGASRTFQIENPYSFIVKITEKHILHTLDMMEESRTDMEYKRVERNHAEQLEKHHQDNMKLQRELHEESMNMQKDLHGESIDVQEKHHVQNARINVSIQANQKVGATVGATVGVTADANSGSTGKVEIPQAKANANASISASVSRAPGITKDTANKILDDCLDDDQKTKHKKTTDKDVKVVDNDSCVIL